MQRSAFASERIQMNDPTTGIKVIQVTSYPTPSGQLSYYDWPSVTPDNGRLVFYGQRYTARSAPWDIYCVDTDGLGLFQLTKRDIESSPSIAMTLDGTTLYAVWPEERILCSIDVETGHMEELVDLSAHVRENHVLGRIHMANLGKRLYISMPNYAEGGGLAIGIDLSTGIVTEYPDFTLYGCDQATGRIVVVRNFMKLGTKTNADGSRVFTNANAEPMKLYSMNEDGSDEKFISTIDMFGHSTILGRTSLIQGTSQPPHRCIWIAEAGKEPYKLVEGPYFWHSGASFEAEWIISDTNWPNEGLKLIHVPTRHWRTLCQNRGSQGHAQSGHAHAALSQDGRIAVFTSDRTGISQVYVAHITEEFRESVIAGELDNPRDNRM